MLEKYHSLLSQLFAGCAFVSTEEKKKEGRQARNLKKKKKKKQGQQGVSHPWGKVLVQNKSNALILCLFLVRLSVGK